jgi:hypothetical protein
VHTLFIDESFRNNYIMVGHLVPLANLTRLRKALKSNVLSGQRSIHFVKESDSRRKYLLSQFRKLGCQTIKVEIAGLDHRNARQSALEALLAIADEFQISNFVLELDETTFLADRATLNNYNIAAEKGEITFEFKARHEEPLLWLADAVAWCLGRGGVWRSRVDPLLADSSKTSR